MRKFLMILAFLFLSIGIASCTGNQKITVSFETNGGNEIEDLEISLNSTSVELPTPTREGYTFDGWYLDTDLSEPFTIAALLTQTGALTLYAKWEGGVTEYTITFESNGGSAVTAITQAEATTVTAPTNPTKEGFTFGGWYSDSALTAAYTFTTMPAENITLYAKWNAVILTQTISFESNGGSAVAAITQDVGSTVTAPTNPTKLGYTFGGWYSDSALTTAYTFTTMPNAALTLYAKWTVNNYTISFEENGGSAVLDLTQAFGSAVVAPANPTKEGNTFGGWYSDSALTTAYIFTTMPAQNITLYAKWTLNNYTITFNTNGGSLISDLTQAFGSAVVAPANPTKEGHTFGGWYSDSALTTAYTFTTMPNAALTLYAKWTVNNYTISFEENGGSAVLDLTQAFGTAVVAPANPTKEGHTFGGWYSDSALTTAYTFTTMPGQNMTLYAKWTINNYSISFEENGGSVVTDLTQAFGSAVIAPANPTKEGHTFGGWYSDSALTTAYTFTTMSAQNITLYAKWTINNYSISFEENGGSVVTDLTQAFGSAVVAPTDPTKVGYTFGGWYSDIALSTAYTFTTMPGQNITLYAKWNVITYTLTFMNAEGILPLQLAEGQTIIFPTPTKVGHQFAGWYEDQYFLTAYMGLVMPANDLTLYAKWALQTYAITFETYSDTTYTGYQGAFSQEIPLPDENPIKAGYTFAGWYLDATFTQSAYNQPMPANTITIYAKWVAEDTLWTIESVLNYKPDHVKVRATIVYKFVGPNPGYYVADETGIIFVMAPADLAIGTIIEFEADFQFHEYVPELINQSNRMVITEGTPQTLTHVETTISAIAHGDYSDPFIMGKPVIIQGVLINEGPQFFLREPGSGEVVAINFKSYDPMSNPFMGHVGEIFRMRALIYGFDPMMERWHVLYDPIVPAETITQTDQEKVDELLDFAVMMLDGEVFYSNQKLQLPTTEPVYGALLTFVTTGDNASYFNPSTGEFQETTVDRLITIRLTVTLNDKSGQVDLVVTLKPITVLTIDAFIALNDGDYGIVEGIVIFSMQEMGMMVIADTTGAILAIETDENPEVGSRVRVHGYKARHMGLTIMMGAENTVMSVLETGLSNPIAPIQATVTQFNGLDPMQTLYWARYFEIHGTLNWDNELHTFFLIDGLVQMPVIVISQDVYEQLIPFDELEIGLRGFALPNFDEEPFLMFIFTAQPGDIIIDYTDQELVNMFAPMLKSHLESQTFTPGSLLDLPTEHPVFALSVAYTVDPTDTSLVSTEWIIDSTIETETFITVQATLTMGNASATVSIEIHVVPVVILTIAEFINLTDENLHFIQGVVMYINPDEKMMIVADATGIIMAPVDLPTLSVGDLVLLEGMKILSEGQVIIANEPSQIVNQIMSHDNDIPLIPDVYTIDELIDNEPTEPLNHLVYVEVLGTLRKDGLNEIYYLEDEFDQQVFVFTMEFEDLSVLNSFVGTDVRIRGFLMNVPLEDMVVLVFLNQTGDVRPMFTDQELALYMKDKLETMYLYKILRPGSTQVLPTSYMSGAASMTYEVYGTNASLYNLTTGIISDTITVHTEINIRATITVGIEVQVAEFIFVVEPIVTSTIAEFLAGAENETFIVRGIVVLPQFSDGPLMIADGTGTMFIVKQLGVEVGDEIIVEGIVTLYEGIKLMWDYETTVLVEVVSKGVANPLTPEVMTITQLNALDIHDQSNWGRYVKVIGYVSYHPDSFFPLLKPEMASSEFIPIIPVYIFNMNVFPDPELLYMYSGYRVVVSGYLFPTFEESDPEAPDRSIMIAASEFMYPDYNTDQEKMDALVAFGEAQLGSKQYHPGEVLGLPGEVPALGATLSWSFVGDVSAVIDTQTMTFLDVTETHIIQVKALINIGVLVQEYTFDLTVAPYPIISILDVYNLQDDEFAKVQAIVVEKLSYYSVILQEPMSGVYLFIQGFNGYDGFDFVNVGDELLVFGQKYTYSGRTYLSGYDDRAYMDVVQSGSPLPLIVTDGQLHVVANLPEDGINYSYYYDLKGHLIHDDLTMSYYLTDGTNYMFLETLNPSVYSHMLDFVDHDVKVRMFLQQKEWMPVGEVWSGIVVDEGIYIADVTFTDEDILSFMSMYIDRLSYMDYKDGLSYALPTTHPIYGGTYGYAIDSLNMSKAGIVDSIIHFTASEIDYTVEVAITITYNNAFRTDSHTLSVYAYTPEVQSFVPGSGGVVPAFTGVTPIGEFTGLFVHKVERSNNFMGGDDMIVELNFPDPSMLGVEYYMIQVYNPVTLAWDYIEDYEGPIKSYWNNFSLVFSSGATVRLITNTGLVSNQVSFSYTDIDTRFAGYYLDMSMVNTGVMYPYVGYGILLEDVTIYDLMGAVVTDGYTINWYRVNPYTFELTAIAGEHNHIYTTTLADIGQYLMVEVLGDGVKVGGFMRLLIDEMPKIHNRAFVQNVTNMGFDIGFEYQVSLEMLEDLLEVRNVNGELIPYYSIETTGVDYVYHVNINMYDVSEVYIEVRNNVIITGGVDEYHMWEAIYTYIYEW